MRRRRTVVRALPPATGPRVNEAIRVPRVILIDHDGHRMGEFLTRDAVVLAQRSMKLNPTMTGSTAPDAAPCQPKRETTGGRGARLLDCVIV